MVRLRYPWRLAAGAVVVVLAALAATVWVSPPVGLVVGVLAAVLFGVLAGRPVVRMARIASSIAEGDYERRIALDRSDELGLVAQAFNTTSARLAEQVETITSDRGQLAAVLESMVEGVVAVDRTERILHLNGVAAALFGLESAESVVGRPIYEATRIPAVAETLSEAIEGDSAQRSLRLDDRSPPRVLELNAAPLRSSSGATIGAVLVLHDVSQLHQLEGMRRQFVSNVSHELKTPLTAIRGFVETLLDADVGNGEAVDAGTQRRFLERIRTQSHRLSSLVADLLSLSRIESADGGLERRPVDVRTPAMESVRGLRAAVEERELELELEMPEEPVVVMAEEEALRQAFSNLIDNAVKYSELGASLAVRVWRDGEMAVFEVRDQGAGIAPEHLERIFERFYRVDRARSRELGGTGLGLAIVKNVAQAFGGEVAVASRVGEGSRFSVRLPLRAVTPEPG